MPPVYDDVNLYPGSFKMARLELAVNKLLDFIGEEVDLNTADFVTIEKYAILKNIEARLESSVEKYVNACRQADSYKLLFRIKKNMPVVRGFLTKARLFDLTNNTFDGYRLAHKQSLYLVFNYVFPYCFRYDSDDISDEYQADLVRLLKFLPDDECVVVKKAPVTSHNLRLLVLVAICSFCIGTIYGLCFKIQKY